MTPVETYIAAFGALLKWRDEMAPGASICVELRKWEYDHAAPETQTSVRLYVGTPNRTIASAEMTDDNLTGALVRLAEDRIANERREAAEAAEAGRRSFR